MAKRVGQTEPNSGNEGTDDAEGKGKVAFETAEAKFLNDENKIVTAVNSDGLLVAVPKPIEVSGEVVYEGFDIRLHKPLKKDQFADLATYLLHQAYVARAKAERFLAMAEDKEKKAARIQKFGDEATRKKAMKVARMREQLAELEAQLKADGVEVDDI